MARRRERRSRTPGDVEKSIRKVDPGGENSASTEQTKRRRKPDWLDLMRRAGTIDDTEFEAAVALRRGFEALTSGVAIAQWDYVRIPGQRATGEWEPEFRQRIEERFNLWADRMTDAKLPIGPILDVIVDGLSCREVDAKWRRRKGTTRALLRDGLTLYRSVRSDHAQGHRRGSQARNRVDDGHGSEMATQTDRQIIACAS